MSIHDGTLIRPRLRVCRGDTSVFKEILCLKIFYLTY